MKAFMHSRALGWYLASLLLPVGGAAHAQASRVAPPCELPPNPFALAGVAPRIRTVAQPTAKERGVVV